MKKQLLPLILLGLTISASGCFQKYDPVDHSSEKSSITSNEHSSKESSNIQSSSNKESSSSLSSSSISSSSKVSSNASSSMSFNHIHSFEENIDDKFLAKPASVYTKAIYHKSCACGLVSEDLMFEYGEPLSYEFVGEIETRNRDQILDPLGTSAMLLKMVIPSTFAAKRQAFLYETEDLNKNRIILSGAITLPYVGETLTTKGIVISSHPSFVDNDKEAVSLNWTQYCTTVVASNIVLEFDLLGYGETKDKIADYHCRHLSDKNTIDGVKCALKLLKDTYNYEKKDESIYLEGYSQGGYNTLSLLRYLEVEASEEDRKLLPITQAFAGSGAYDVGLLFQESIFNNTCSKPEHLVEGLLSMYEYHRNEFNGLTLSDFLTPDGLRFAEVLKLKNEDALNEILLEKDDEQEIKFRKISNIFTKKLLDKDPECMKVIENATKEENLLDGNWIPTSSLYLYYTPNDEMVTPKCSLKAIELFKESIGQNITVKEDTNVEGHIEGGTQYYVNVVLTIFANSLL